MHCLRHSPMLVCEKDFVLLPKEKEQVRIEDWCYLCALKWAMVNAKGGTAASKRLSASRRLLLLQHLRAPKSHKLRRASPFPCQDYTGASCGLSRANQMGHICSSSDGNCYPSRPRTLFPSHARPNYVNNSSAILSQAIVAATPWNLNAYSYSKARNSHPLR